MKDADFIMDGQEYTYLPDISKKDDELSKIVGAQSYEEFHLWMRPPV